MVTSLTNAAGVIARLLLVATALFFNGARLLEPGIWEHPAATEHTDARPDGGEKAGSGFHAEVIVGRGKKQVTVQLEFGGARERGEDESL
jgi:hypothetical protein